MEVDRSVLDNPNPVVYAVPKREPLKPEDLTEEFFKTLDSRKVFDLIRDIKDPEFPMSLEELNVVSEDQITVVNDFNDSFRLKTVDVSFTPTVNHCSLATLIGLCINVKLLQNLPSYFKISVKISEGSHSTEAAVNKQLNDKERVAAALENPKLIEVVDSCIKHQPDQNQSDDIPVADDNKT